jgi:hypothetical protein
MALSLGVGQEHIEATLSRLRPGCFPNVRVLYASGYPIAPRRDVTGSEFFSKPYLLDDVLEACTR